jgi:hypothetical protein
MSFEQVYYTSSTVGLRGGKGFQIHAAGAAIEAGLLQQIERLGVYVPPVSAPTRPSSEEIERFPVSLLFQALPEGCAVVAQTKYVGMDYSGRFGNYFCHSLIASIEDFAREGTLPIELWRSPAWTTIESETRVLPAMERLQHGSVINPARVQAFLEEEDRMEHVPAFMAAAEQALRSRRRVIIVDDSDRVALWIAVASYALPRRLALRLSFNTYAKNPYQTDVLVTGTTPDSDFGFAPHEIEHSYFVFDFVGRRFTRVAATSRFTEHVVRAYTSARIEELAGFRDFIERVAPDLEPVELDSAHACYAVNAACGGIDIPAAVRWCGTRLDRFDDTALSELLARVVEMRPVEPAALEAVTELYRAATKLTVSEERRSAVERAYLEWLLKGIGGTMPTHVFAGIVRSLNLSPTVVGRAQALRPAWFAQIRQTREPDRVCTLLDLGEALGFLEGDAQILRLLGGSVLGPGLVHGNVQAATRRLMATPLSKEIVGGVAGHLATKVAEPSVFDAMAPMFADVVFATALADEALRQRAVGLYFRILGVARPSVVRSTTFRECLDGARRIGDMTATHVENAFEAVWRGAVPTVPEALETLAAAGALAASASNLVKRVADALAAGADLREPGLQRKELASRLAEAPLRKLLGEKEAIVDAFELAKDLTEGMGAIDARILDAVRWSDAFGGPMAAALLELAAKRLLGITDRNLHRDVLLRAHAVSGQRFIVVYGRVAAARLTGKDPERPRRTAELFRTWIQLEGSISSAPLQPLFEDVLPRVLRTWPRKYLDAVGAALRADAAAFARWTEWRSAFLGRAGLFHWIKCMRPFR